jgi:DNA-binding transcriptional LysR family regulator
MTLNLRQLECFVAVAEELSFTRAAERLHIAQPPLSQQIKRLETGLGVPLLDRNRRTVRLTREGAVLLDRARRFIAQAEDLEFAMTRLANGQIGVLRVGYVGSACYEILPRIVQRYRQRFPDIELRLSELGTEPQLGRLLADELDIGFVRASPTDPRLRFQQLIEEPLVAVLPEGHRLSGGDVAIEDLRHEAFVIHRRELGTNHHDQIIALCRRAGFSPRVIQEAGDMQAVVSLVSAGVGVGLVPAMMTSIKRPHVVFRAVPSSDVRLQMGLAWRAVGSPPVVQHFVSTARDAMQGPETLETVDS